MGDSSDSCNLLGKWLGGIDCGVLGSLEMNEKKLEGEEKRLFLGFMQKMLQWLPEKRNAAGELYHDPWLWEHLKA